MGPGRYRMCLSLVFTSATSRSMSCSVRLAGDWAGDSLHRGPSAPLEASACFLRPSAPPPRVRQDPRPPETFSDLRVAGVGLDQDRRGEPYLLAAARSTAVSPPPSGCRGYPARHHSRCVRCAGPPDRDHLRARRHAHRRRECRQIVSRTRAAWGTQGAAPKRRIARPGPRSRAHACVLLATFTTETPRWPPG